MQKQALKKNKFVGHFKKEKRAIRKNRITRYFDKKKRIKDANGDMFEISFFN